MKLSTRGFHPYSVRFSPYVGYRWACSASQHYGLVGNGRLYIWEQNQTRQGDHVDLRCSFDTQDGMYDVCWSEHDEHQLVTAGADSLIRLWDMRVLDRPVLLYKGHDKEIYQIDWCTTRKEHFASASWDRSIRIWNVNRPESLVTSSSHMAEVYGVSWYPHSETRLASCSADTMIHIHDLHSGVVALKLPHHHQVLSLDWNKYREECLVTGSIDGTLSVWDLRMIRAPYRQVMKAHSRALKRVQWSPHYRDILLTSSYDTSIGLWNLGGGDLSHDQKPMELLYHHTEFVYGIDFNLHQVGQIISCGFDEMVILCQLESLKQQHQHV